MRVDVLSLFPALVDAPLAASIVGRARLSGALELHLHDIRQWTTDVHRTADDTPYGGGAGMVMKAEPIVIGVESIIAETGAPDQIFILSASGLRFSQQMAAELARFNHVILICGHYEGIDDRVRQILGADEISIGDFVLTGGELAAAVIIDSVTRLLPGVISPESVLVESHTSGLLEHPQYTRPAAFRGIPIPEILASGNHAAIARWRHEQAIAKTARNRPDLLAKLSPADREVLHKIPVTEVREQHE